jgi:hypothetical protein
MADRIGKEESHAVVAYNRINKILASQDFQISFPYADILKV